MANTAKTRGVQTKLFIGVALRPDIRMLLDQSPVWKRIRAVREEGTGDLIELSFQSRSYVGLFAGGEHCSIADLRSLSKHINNKLGSYSPDLDVDKLTLEVFPQVFIS
ncbi:MAG: hypothetical protein KDK78_07035 [Chlamydiia bacterium]|nr:hypothetical protein [Chlamydiia bacterium]